VSAITGGTRIEDRDLQEYGVLPMIVDNQEWCKIPPLIGDARLSSV
jgi:hypothetical protein